MEAWFGDAITLTYASKTDAAAKFEKTINVVKGTDGNLLVFEKKYATEKVAIESQFRMAEAFRSEGKTDEAIEAFSKASQLDQGGGIKALADKAIEELKKKKTPEKPPAKP